MRRTLVVALLLALALALPAGARASTISQDAGNVYFNGGANDQVFMGINMGFDNEFASSAIFFVPIATARRTASSSARRPPTRPCR
jgi:hypothetical protein